MTAEAIPSGQDARDKGLMARVARGDHDAFRDLVVHYQRTIHAIAYRYLGDPADAEEIAQETFCRLFEAAPRYRPEPDATFRTYLLRIATNLCTNRRTRAYRTREEGRDFGAIDEGASDGGDPRQSLLGVERSDAVRRAVLALPDDQRMAMLLFRFDELHYDEISAITGKSVASVTSSLWRARTALRAALTDWIDPSSSLGSPDDTAQGTGRPPVSSRSKSQARPRRNEE